MRYRYVGEADHYCPALGLEPIPGELYDFGDVDPASGVFVPEDQAPAKKAPRRRAKASKRPGKHDQSPATPATSQQSEQAGPAAGEESK